MNISISGHTKEDLLSQMIIQKQVQNECDRLSRLTTIQDIAIHIDRYKESGTRIKYSIKIRLMTNRGMLHANDHAWDLAAALGGALKKLEREVSKKKDTRV